jgi:hypothetical protein
MAGIRKAHNECGDGPKQLQAASPFSPWPVAGNDDRSNVHDLFLVRNMFYKKVCLGIGPFPSPLAPFDFRDGPF